MDIMYDANADYAQLTTLMFIFTANELNLMTKLYRTLNTNIKNKCTQVKEEWVKEMCAQIEAMSIIDTQICIN